MTKTVYSLTFFVETHVKNKPSHDTSYQNCRSNVTNNKKKPWNTVCEIQGFIDSSL